MRKHWLVGLGICSAHPDAAESCRWLRMSSWRWFCTTGNGGTAQGYLRGELLNSLSLAPGEELKVEFFTWDRQRIERERASDASRESSITGSVTSRASLEVVNNLQFKIGVGAHGKAGAGLSLESLDLPVDVSGEVGANFQSELAGAVTTTSQTVNEATLTATNVLRASQKTRIVEVSEIGAETRSTRTIRNENRCHTINYD